MAQGTPPDYSAASSNSATPADELAWFSGNPAEESQNYDDPWEMVDQALNAVVGYGRTTADIVELIHKGQNGMRMPAMRAAALLTSQGGK